ncbi:24717_t:CDS:2, partial [Dentiscutata erythropus]
RIPEREKRAEFGVITQEFKALNISHSLTSDEEMEIQNTSLKDDFNGIMKDFTKDQDNKNLDVPIINQDLNLESDDGSETIFTSSDQADMKLSDDKVQLDEIIPQPNDEDSENSRLNCGRALSISTVHQNWAKSEGPFSDTELDETRKPEKPIERRMHKISPLSDTELEYEPTKPEKSNNEWSWRWGALPVRTSEKIEHWQEGTGDKEWKDLKDQEDFGFGRDEFSENPQLLNDKSLVFKYDNRFHNEFKSIFNDFQFSQLFINVIFMIIRYFTGPAILPLITSLLVFKKPLPEKENVSSQDTNKSTKFYAKTLRLT